MVYLVVFFGAGIGGVLRQIVNVVSARLLGLHFPYGTLTVNIVGSIAMGAITALFALKSDLPQELKLFLTTGILGGFTTFSTFSLDAVSLWDAGHQSAAFTYVLASIILSLAGLAVGMAVVSWSLSNSAS
ncbi:fluoride efflux transporter CrcB [Aliirhizobium cellulosilyticum]|uniref:Fluoride-specific ion channel FluC n=1 Tax=Aliirhizobium cellulosilyticum TaxID=393664 RepID=A0A7W6TF55_9HYPH|nr:fluoride efflux transporter CrcB [Rhizobium cellulosilyticum]MBB4349444.1 CrcB protein [Rhizobium cellulosilyticum]MBB4412334.1 CrcB protein [Rhizobium cellulosilyticum]MBB4446965.1 CrcB protein [Rhizobium cellulosilyticum]